MSTYLLHTPTLRSSHLERLVAHPRAGVELTVLATDLHPDCDPRLVVDPPFALVVCSPAEAVRRVRKQPPDLLEVTEPLWAAEWPFARRLVEASAGRSLVATYALDNLPPSGAPPDAAVLDAVVYGSGAARRVYEQVYGEQTAGWRASVVEERRGRCAACFPGATATAPAAREVVLCCELSERKGVDVLQAAWPDVAAEHPGWRLRIFGYGPRVSAVVSWAAGQPSVEVVVGAGRRQVHDALRRAALVVLASRRVPGWREQAGLSLLEGLAHGCRLVTTTETGLAQGLAAEGHLVVAPGDAAALAAGLTGGIAQAASVKVLPEPGGCDSRVSAQAWLAGLVAG